MKLNFAEKRRGVDTEVTLDRIDLFIEEIKKLIEEIYSKEIAFVEPNELPFQLFCCWLSEM